MPDRRGNGASDVDLGDNGTLLRVVSGADGSASEAVDAAHYPEDSPPPADAFRLRIGDEDVPGYNGTTRFCTSSAGLGTASTCEPSGAFGGDTLWGDDGDDRAWGQDGNDTLFGEAGNDDLLGELGDDTLYGSTGEDAILGNRGGVLGEYVDASDNLSFTISFTQVPAETYNGLPVGTLSRKTDLLADTDGTSWVNDVVHPGLNEGGIDHIRGGPDRDSIHAGFGDDLANGTPAAMKSSVTTAPTCSGAVVDVTRWSKHVQRHDVRPGSGPSIAGALGADHHRLEPARHVRTGHRVHDEPVAAGHTGHHARSMRLVRDDRQA